MLVGVVACQVGSCSCSCCRQVTAVTLTAAAVVAIIRVGSHSPRVVEGGGGCQVVVVVDKCTCLCSKVVKVGWLLKVCKQNTVNEKYAGTPLHPLSSRCTTTIQNLFQCVRQWWNNEWKGSRYLKVRAWQRFLRHIVECPGTNNFEASGLCPRHSLCARACRVGGGPCHHGGCKKTLMWQSK